MKLVELIEELKSKESFKKFKNKFPNSYFSVGFFMLNQDEKQSDSFQLDFFIPLENKIASFEYPFNSYKIHNDKIKNQEEIENLELKIDLDNLKELIKTKFKKDFSKIIAIFQGNVWNITCIDGLDIKRLKINAYTKEIIHSNNLNLTDIIQIKKT